MTSDQDEDIGEFLDALERGHSLCERFNVPGTSRDARRGILEELFGQPLDPRTSINPSFRCDVGTNIHLGRHVEVNFDCVFLDSAFGRVLENSGIMERGESIEARFIADPSDPVRRAAWYAVEDELASMDRPSYKRIADHVDHAVSLVGTNHVGLGSDFDGISVTPAGMENISHFRLVLEELKSRGYSETDIEKIAGGNFLRLL